MSVSDAWRIKQGFGLVAQNILNLGPNKIDRI